MRLRHLAVVLWLAFSACLGDSELTAPVPEVSIEQTTFAASLNVNLSASTRTTSGLYYRDLAAGTGPIFAPGDSVGVYYTGALANGNVFDSRQSPAPTFSFRLGVGRVIRGWDEGLVGMRVGGSRQLIIPSALGYGPSGTPGGPIPPNAVLVFTVTAVSKQ